MSYSLINIIYTIPDTAWMCMILASLGPVVQSFVSLTNLLRGQLLKSFTSLYPNTLKFFVGKMREAKAPHIFSTKNIGIFQI